jgi:hypothetical protein
MNNPEIDLQTFSQQQAQPLPTWIEEYAASGVEKEGGDDGGLILLGEGTGGDAG